MKKTSKAAKIDESYKKYIHTFIAQLKKPSRFKTVDARARELLINSLEYIASL